MSVQQPIRSSEAEPARSGHRLRVTQQFKLDCGIDLAPFTIAYQTYGQLNPDRSNAILVCHALTGDQYLAEPHPITDNPGWWSTLAGPGKAVAVSNSRLSPRFDRSSFDFDRSSDCRGRRAPGHAW